MCNNEKKIESAYLFSIIRERYGERLNHEELEEVRKGIESLVDIAKELRSVKLENSVEPFSLFIPYRKEE